MSDAPNDTGEQSADVMASLIKYMPQLIKTYAENQPAAAMGAYNADAAVSPKYAELNQGLYDKYGRQQAQTTSEIARQNQLEGQKTDLQLAKGGGALVDEALALDRRSDPNFYANSDTITKAIGQLFADQDPNKLTGSERAEIERSVARGTSFTPSASETAGNALTFGKELQGKQSRFADTVAKAASAVPQIRNGMNGFSIATNKNVGGSGVGTAAPTATTGAGNNVWNAGNNWTSSAWGYGAASESKKPSFMDQLGQGMEIGGKVVGGIAGAF